MTLASAALSTAEAQRQISVDSASFRGRVLSKSDGTAVPDAEVSLSGLKLNTSTDSTGGFRFFGLPAGPLSITIRRLGFAEWDDTVTLAPRREVTRNYMLAAQSPMLDTVRTQAAGSKYISPSLQEFESRRLQHSAGYFVSDSTFRRNENTTLGNVLSSRMPGMMMQYFEEHRVAVSTRKACRGPVMLHACSSKPDCVVAIYVDGQLFFNAQMASKVPASGWPDMEVTFPVNTLAGAEFYPSAATAPAGMSVDDDGCGSLWLWTREK